MLSVLSLLAVGQNLESAGEEPAPFVVCVIWHHLNLSMILKYFYTVMSSLYLIKLSDNKLAEDLIHSLSENGTALVSACGSEKHKL